MTPAIAQETLSYTYDQRGRLVSVNHGTSGKNGGVASSYTYDAADNRTQMVVSGNSATVSTFSIGNASANEGTSTSFTVTRSGSTAGTQSVQYSTADGTAVAGSDYTAISPAQTVTFAPGETQKSVSVATSLDNLHSEGSETFVVNLSNPSAGAGIGTGQGTGTIIDQ